MLALTRRICVILQRMWIDGTTFRFEIQTPIQLTSKALHLCLPDGGLRGPTGTRLR